VFLSVSTFDGQSIIRVEMQRPFRQSWVKSIRKHNENLERPYLSGLRWKST